MEKIIKYKKELFTFLVLVVISNFVLTIFLNRGHIFEKFEYKKWEDKYNKSQWIVPQSKNEISDEDLYIYVGSKLALGHDPSLLNAEMPPMGKYLIGFSQIISGRIGVYGIFFSALSLILFFVLNKLIFKSNLIAVIPVVIFSFELLFRQQIGVSLLDAQYLSFLFLTFIFILKKKYLFAGISAGFFMATKSPFITLVLYAAIFSFFFLNKSLNLKNFILMPATTLIAYTFIHIKIFLLGHGLIYFLQVQKYMTNFYQTGAKGVIGAVFPMILGGYWLTWFNKDGFIREWNILWPIIFVLSLFTFYKLFKNRKNNEGILLISIWLVLYTAFLIFVPIFSRYLLLSLPFMYNLAIWALLKTIKPQLLSRLSS